MDPDDYETTQTKPAHSDPPENDIIHHRKNLILKAMDETDDEDETPTTPTATSSADELDLDEDDSRTELQSLSTMDTEAFRRLREERRKESRRRDKKKQQVASIKKQQATSIKKKQQVATVAGSTHKSQGAAAAAASNNNSNSSKYNKKSSTPTSSPSPTHVTTSRRRTNVAFSKHSNNQQEDTSTIGSSTVSSGYYSNTSNASGSTSGTDYRSRFSRRHNRGGSGSNAENCCGLLLNRLPIFQLTILSMAIIIFIQLDVMEVNLEKTTGIMGLRGSSKLVYDYTPYQEGAQPARTLGALPKDDDDYKTDNEDGKGKDENKEDESKLDALLSEDEKSGSGGDRYSKVLQQENMIGQVMPQSIMDGNHNAIQNIQSQSNGSQLQQEEEQQVGKKSNWDNLGAPSQQQQTENTFQGSDNVQAGDQQQPQGAQVVSWVKENAPPSTSEGDVEGEGERSGSTIFQQQTQPQQQQLGVIGGVVGGNIDSGVVGEDLNAVINNQAPPQQQQLPAVESTSEQYFRQAVVEQQQQQVQVVGEQQQQQPPLFTQQVQQAQQMQMQQQGDQDLQPSLGDETTFSQLVQQLHQEQKQPQQQTNQEVEQPLEQQPSLQQDTQLQVQSQGEGEVESSSQAVSSKQQLIDPAAQSSPVVAVASDLQNSISEKEKKLKQLQQMLAERQKQFQAAVPGGEIVQLKEEEEESPTQVDGGGEEQMVDNTGDAAQIEQGGDVNQLPNSEEEQPQLKSETGNEAGENNREGLASSNLQEQQQQHEEEQPMVNQNELNELRAASMNISNLRGGAVPQEVSQGEGESNVVNDQNEDVEVKDVERHDGSDEEVKESEQLDQSAKEDSPQDNGGEEEKETATNQSQEESRADTPVVIQQQNLITSNKPAGTNSGVIVGQQAHQRGTENFALPDGDFISAVDENGNIINDPNAPPAAAAAVEVAPSPKDEDDVDLTDIDPFKNDSRNFQVKMPANALTEEEKVQLAQLEKEGDASPKEEMTLAEKLAQEG